MNQKAAERTIRILKAHGINPTAQRVAVADFVLNSSAHPSAESIREAVCHAFPMIARATIYCTLELLVQKKLVRELVITGRRVLFDRNLEPHHHFVDERSDEVVDVVASALDVRGVDALSGFEVRECSVVMRGRRVRTRGRSQAERGSGGSSPRPSWTRGHSR